MHEKLHTNVQLFSKFNDKNKNRQILSVRICRFMEQGTGVEPAQSAWEAEILPIN